MSKRILTPVILCGGAGTRLWPLSNNQTPKQFLTLFGQSSMLTLTADRVRHSADSSIEFGRPLAIGSQAHEHLLSAQLPQARILLEPFGRNSAAAVAAAAAASQPDDILLILPADHHIKYPEKFHEAVAAGMEKAIDGSIITFGIEPTFPSTGYGYIELEGQTGRVRKANRFVEKPDAETAQSYLESGRYVWNAGIFLFKASAMLDAFRAHAPDVLDAVNAAMPADFGDEPGVLDPAHFDGCPSISVDYAIMEKVDEIYGVPVDMGWSDVGDYDALWKLSETDASGNALSGNVSVIDTANCYVRSQSLPIYATGVSDLIIVANEHNIMVCPITQAQDVKKLANLAGKKAREPGPLSQKAHDILKAQFDLWSGVAWDHEKGGFHECVDASGTPVALPRRTRVTARQVFSFASGIELGLVDRDKAMDLVGKGLDQLQGPLRNPTGGWAHKSSSDGKISDPTEDLYDHAFIMLAGATSYRVLKDERGLAIAKAALEHVQTNWRDPDHGGFQEGSAPAAERRANPHMHLLEAFLALYRATQEERYLALAKDIVVLFERRFFDPETDILREFFEADWTPAPGERGELFEPGHHYEWATLLLEFEQASGRDVGSWRRRLIAKANEDGSAGDSQFCLNAALSDGTPVDRNMRLWPQLEKLRALTVHKAGAGEVAALFDAICETYIDPVGPGLLVDEVGPDLAPLDKPVPASMLYHMVTAFMPLL